MDSDDATLCLEDIGSVRLVANEILKIVRRIGGVNGNPSATFSSSLSPISQSSSIRPILYDQGPLLSLKSQISDLGTKMERTSLEILSTCIPRTMNGSMIAQGLEQEDSDLAPLDELCSWFGLSETSLTLLLVSAGVWLSVVLLALLWMRLYDLRYKPRVVSFLIKVSEIILLFFV